MDFNIFVVTEFLNDLSIFYSVCHLIHGCIIRTQVKNKYPNFPNAILFNINYMGPFGGRHKLSMNMIRGWDESRIKYEHHNISRVVLSVICYGMH